MTSITTAKAIESQLRSRKLESKDKAKEKGFRKGHTRVPSNIDSNSLKEGENYLEDVVLHNVDVFLYNLELRLNELEEYGVQKLDQVDESVRHAYDVLVEVRDEVLGQGKQKAEKLRKILEVYYKNIMTEASSSSSMAGVMDVIGGSDLNYEDDAIDSLAGNLSQGLKYLEEKLAHVESTCFEVVDGTLAIGVQYALQAAKSRLLTYDEMPIQWRENPYIVRGYRFCKSYSECLWGLVTLHNETCNIWTHLLGFFILLGLAFYHLPEHVSWNDLSFMDKFIMLIFLIAAMKCLVFSVAWHTFCGISKLKHKQNFACVDYTGITLLITTSVLSTEYTGLYCHDLARNIYMTITAITGLAGTVFTWSPSFDKKESRSMRIAFFVSFAIAGLMGFTHAAMYHGIINTMMFYWPVFKSLLCYSCGVVFYGLLIPERWCPGGIFDYFGMSHNLWHISVFGGIYFHYLAVARLLLGAKSFSCVA